MTATLADQIAQEACDATRTYPAFDSADRFQHMLEYIRDKGTLADMEADVIRACREKAGLA